MTRSLGEVASMSYLATRGAGYPWGLAEEASLAVNWLTAAGGNGCGLLRVCLEAGLADAWHDHCPDPVAGWQGSSVLCPLMTGAALSDHGFFEGDLPETVAPGLLIPFLARSLAANASLTLHTEVGEAAVFGRGLAITGDLGQKSTVQIRLGSTRPTAASVQRAKVRPEDWDVLGRFAARTYAPATEASRLKGAGAGLSDND